MNTIWWRSSTLKRAVGYRVEDHRKPVGLRQTPTKLVASLDYNKMIGFSALTVTNLTPGKEYKFRVSAVNAEGESEPLQTEESIIAKNPFGKIHSYSWKL